MNTKLIFTLVLAALSLQVQADGRRLAAGWQEESIRMAQLSEKERLRMREQWQSLEPEERAQLRREFQNRLQALPPEEREQRRREIMERWKKRSQRGSESTDRRDGESYGQDIEQYRGGDDSPGFGRGYERREMQRGGGRGR